MRIQKNPPTRLSSWLNKLAPKSPNGLPPKTGEFTDMPKLNGETCQNIVALLEQNNQSDANSLITLSGLSLNHLERLLNKGEVSEPIYKKIKGFLGWRQ